MRQASATQPSRRLPPLRREELSAQQRRLWDALTRGPRGATAVRESGQLTGPFDVLLRSPQIGEAVAELGTRLRFGSSLSARETELVILATAGYWRARFAWLRHAAYASKAGISDDVVGAIARGESPDFESAADRAVYRLVAEVLRTGQASDDVYADALATLGERKLVDVVALVGYYTLTAFLLNVFDVPLPAGASVPWDHPLESSGSEG